MQAQEPIDPNRIIMVKDLFNSAGWQEYEARIRELMGLEDSQLGLKMCDNEPIQDANFINFHKAKRRAFFEALLVKDEMLSEVDPEWEEKIEETGFETSKPY